MAGLIIDHLKAVRIPLLIIVAGCVLTFWVDQISELFYLLVLADAPVCYQIGAFTTSLLLGIAVWHTSRTVYRFDIPTIPALADPRAEKLREWLPRVLGALVPVLMSAGCLTAIFSPKVNNANEVRAYYVPLAFMVEAAVLMVLLFYRRKILGRLTTFAATPSGDPRVTAWSQLGKPIRRIYIILFVANFLALVVAANWPGLISTIGPLAVVLLSATFLTATGTYLTILAARWQVPLLSVLFIWTVALQWAGLNDNHRVRLYPEMNSKDAPDQQQIDDSAPLDMKFTQYAEQWRDKLGHDEPIYLVSAEGGGIRAAAWTAVVLLELEKESHGEFSRHMLAGSGVSGGSLGLALFSALIKARDEGVIADIDSVANQFLREDYLGPATETMFLTDFLQRFLPHALLIDRGQRLEYGWEQAWTRACEQQVVTATANQASSSAAAAKCSIFSQPWKNLWSGTARVPVLFLNSTVVQSGQRFIQYPFKSMNGKACGAGELTDDAFSAAISSACALPASAPLSAVVHNSARFTYVSPAGTLMLRDGSTGQGAQRSGKSRLQLVDGGYFENSGTATLIEVAQILASTDERCSTTLGLAAEGCPIRFVHISNDPTVEGMLPGNGCDSHAGQEQFGEASAPLIALLNTRGARGLLSRTLLRKEVEPRTEAAAKGNAVATDRLFHFRLCKGEHHLPLGWTLSQASLSEMANQLHAAASAAGQATNKEQIDRIRTALTGHSPP